MTRVGAVCTRGGRIDVDLDFLADILSAGPDPHGRRITLWGDGIDEFLPLSEHEALALAQALIRASAVAQGVDEPWVLILDREATLADLMEAISGARAGGLPGAAPGAAEGFGSQVGQLDRRSRAGRPGGLPGSTAPDCAPSRLATPQGDHSARDS